MAEGVERPDLHGGGGEGRRYSAFISYSHADGAFAKRLHRRLEGYRLPHRALARADGAALAGARLKPVFRDIDELTAAHDLTAAVREAIASSDHLIVVCSPHAAASPWVAKEIELFRELHGPAGILAVLAEGDPRAAFPEALRGAAADLEPLAADFRGDGAKQHLALLKLVAALAGVRLDELMQRDAQRRLRTMAFAAGGAVAGIAVVAGLSIAALTERADANAQRQRAGGLGEFMATDLRRKLEAAGRHDILDQVNRAALESYKDQDLARLTPDQLEQRAKLLQGAGKDAEKKGDLKTAQAQFEAAHRITATLLAAKPNDPKRLFAHAQSEYWMGLINWREGNAAGAKAGFDAYARLADQLVATDPRNDEWRKEKVYAVGDLGMLALRQAGDAATAERYFAASVAELDAIARHNPADPEVMSDRANGLAWLADAQRLEGHLQAATASRAEQRRILDQMLAADPRNVEAKRYRLFNELAVARIAMAQGDTARAASLLKAGHVHALDLQAQDPENKDFPKQARMFELFEVRLWLDRPAAKRPPASRISSVLGDCSPRGSGSDNLEISDFCGVLLARLHSQQGDGAGAAAALAPVQDHAAKRHDILTARWGLNLAAEARPVHVAENKGGMR
jgi:hypothetical protein